MPSAEEILVQMQGICREGKAFSPFIRLVLVALVIFFIRRKRIHAAFLATFVSIALLASSLMSIGFEDYANQASLLNFAVLFAVGLLWGREALTLPKNPRFSLPAVIIAGLFGLAAFFYPYFTEGILETVLFAPLGIAPCPTLLAAVAAIIASRRSYSYFTVIPTWVVTALFGAGGALYLGIAMDWFLVAAVPVSVCFYLLTPKEDKRKTSKRFKRRH